MPEASTTPATPPESPEVVAMKRETALLDQRTALLNAQKKLVETATPTLPAGAAGTVALTGEPLEIRLMAYRAIERVAKAIATRVREAVNPERSGPPPAIVIRDDAALASVTGYRAFAAQLTQLVAGVEAEIELGQKVLAGPAAPKLESVTAAIQLAPLVASAALKTVSGLVSLFRQEVAVASATLTITDRTLTTAVVGQMAADGFDVYDPSLVAADLAAGTSTLVQQLDALSERRVEVDALLNRITKEKADKADEALTVLTDTHARLTALAATVDDLRANLVKADATSGVAPLVGLLRAEALAPIVATAHVLWLQVSAAGGVSDIRQPSTFQRKGRRLFSGGVVAEFVLFTAAGAVADAGTERSYSGLCEFDEPEAKVNLIDP